MTQQEDYRTLTFNLLPSLVYLDGVDREGHEALSGSEEEGNSDVQYNADINLSATHTHTHTHIHHTTFAHTNTYTEEEEGEEEESDEPGLEYLQRELGSVCLLWDTCGISRLHAPSLLSGELGGLGRL